MSWNLTARLNPELVRTARVVAPRRRVIFTAALTAALLAGGGWLLWESAAPARYEMSRLTGAGLRALHLREFGQSAFKALTVVLFGLMFVLAPAANGLSFVQERLRGTLLFQQMTLLSPARLVWGKLAGSGLFAYFVAAMLVPCAVLAAALGRVHWDGALRLYVFLFVGGLAWQAVGLFISASLASSERGSRVGLLAGPAVAFAGAVSALALVRFFTPYFDPTSFLEYYEREYTWHFYGAAVPAYAGATALMAFAGVWALVGAVRSVKSWQLIPTGPRAGWVLLACAEVLLVGLLWGRRPDDSQPADRLAVYLLLNWMGLAALAGWSALGRGRLREWWSAGRDEASLLRRGEVGTAAKTYALALGLSLAGACALWWGYHVEPNGARGPLDAVRLAGVALCFALTALGTAAGVQWAAMYRFRLGGWAGVVLLAVFYLILAMGGASLRDRANPAVLANPVLYAETVTRGDYYMDSYFETSRREYFGGREREVLLVDPIYEPHDPPTYSIRAAFLTGLLVEGVISLCLLGLAYARWTRTREEMLGAE